LLTSELEFLLGGSSRGEVHAFYCADLAPAIVYFGREEKVLVSLYERGDAPPQRLTMVPVQKSQTTLGGKPKALCLILPGHHPEEPRFIMEDER